MNQDDQLPPRLPWPTDWKPRIRGASTAIGSALALIALAIDIFAALSVWVKVLVAIAVILVAIFQDALFAAMSALGVILKRIQHYEQLHAWVETLQQDIGKERTYIEGLVRHLLTQNRGLYLSVRDALKTPEGDYVIVIGKGPAMSLAVEEKVLVFDHSTAEILATFQITEARADDYLARIVSVRAEGGLWWGYIHQQVDSHAAIDTKAVIMSLNVKDTKDDE